MRESLRKSQDAEDLPLAIRMSSTRVVSQCAKESEKGASLHALNLHMMAPTSTALVIISGEEMALRFPRTRPGVKVWGVGVWRKIFHAESIFPSYSPMEILH